MANKKKAPCWTPHIWGSRGVGSDVPPNKARARAFFLDPFFSRPTTTESTLYGLFQSTSSIVCVAIQTVFLSTSLIHFRLYLFLFGSLWLKNIFFLLQKRPQEGVAPHQIWEGGSTPPPLTSFFSAPHPALFGTDQALCPVLRRAASPGRVPFFEQVKQTIVWPFPRVQGPS